MGVQRGTDSWARSGWHRKFAMGACDATTRGFRHGANLGGTRYLKFKPWDVFLTPRIAPGQLLDH